MSPSEELVTVGVDVGGTNTDAAVIAGRQVLGFAKHVTTRDITTGVVRAVAQALNNAQDNASGGAIIKVERVHIGTTHFVNAVVQRKNLVRVSVIRLCGRASNSLPPFSYFPESVRQVIQGTVHLADGGYEFDGITEISAVNPDQIEKITQEIKDAGVKNVVVCGIFSPVTADQETKVAEMIKSAWPEVSVTPSHQIGHLGILERENAAVLNETVRPLAEATVKAFREALDHLGLTCPFYLTQNDGTLISADQAIQMPVFTFASGPTNSMRGAAFLSGIKDGIVIDIGGTTSDVGMLIGGFPREASTKVKVAEVQTNFRMPDVYSIGLGGGSVVKEQEDSSGKSLVQIGPVSVGYQLTEKAMIFGGSVTTASDIAVAAELANMGDAKKVASFSDEFVKAALQEMRDKLEIAIDQVKVNKESIPVILVGGGSVLVDRTNPLQGCSEVITPPHFEVANAVGAALSQVSGSVDIVISLVDKSRTDAIEEAKSLATKAALTAGAEASSIKITDIQEAPLAYLPGNATQVKVKAVGDLRVGSAAKGAQWSPDLGVEVLKALPVTEGVTQTHGATGRNLCDEGASQGEDDYPEMDPTIDHSTGEWLVSHWDIECIAVGAGILGCGGGGNPNSGRLRAHRELQLGRKIRVITPERFSKLKEHHSNKAVMVAHMGAPTILVERLPSDELADALETIGHLYNARGYMNETQDLKNKANLKIVRQDGVTFIDRYNKNLGDQPEQTGDPCNVAAVLCAEIGGTNGMEPLVVGAKLDLPVIDADFMGRAFPELQMCTHFLNGIPGHPAVLASYNNWHAVALQVDTPKHLEDFFRTVCIKMGCSGGITERPLTAQEVQETAVLHSVSRAWRLGRAVLHARQEKSSPIDAILKNESGQLLLTGKVTDVERKTVGGFARGKLVVEGFGKFAKQNLLVDFQNENLIAQVTVNGKTEILACTPDLITIVDVDTGEPLSTETMRYGLRVAVLAIPASPRLTTDKAIKVFGPQAFGYSEEEVTYRSTMKYIVQDAVPPM